MHTILPIGRAAARPAARPRRARAARRRPRRPGRAAERGRRRRAARRRCPGPDAERSRRVSVLRPAARGVSAPAVPTRSSFMVCLPLIGAGPADGCSHGAAVGGLGDPPRHRIHSAIPCSQLDSREPSHHAPRAPRLHREPLRGLAALAAGTARSAGPGRGSTARPRSTSCSSPRTARRPAARHATVNSVKKDMNGITFSSRPSPGTGCPSRVADGIGVGGRHAASSRR